MKKILSSVLCLIMMLSMGITAFAETNDFVLTYANEASYEIVIPEEGNINVATGKGTITIGVTEANLAENTVVKVTASSTNYADGSWYLVNTKNSSDKIAYTIGTTDGGSDIANGVSVLSADGATSATFYVTVSDTSKIGTFTDTITFTSEIVNATATITLMAGGDGWLKDASVTYKGVRLGSSGGYSAYEVVDEIEVNIGDVLILQVSDGNYGAEIVVNGNHVASGANSIYEYTVVSDAIITVNDYTQESLILVEEN